MSSGFVTEKEIEEKRKVRQEEWEKVRKPEDPLEVPLAPEQLPDRRSLYERLQEQKTKKQDDFEEAHKLKNLVKVLDDDEADFLEHVDKVRMDEERRKRLEEAKELLEFRNKVAELREKDLDVLIKQEIGLIKTDKKPSNSAVDESSIGVKKTSQMKLLAGLVKRKSQSSNESVVTSSNPEKKARTEESSKSSNDTKNNYCESNEDTGSNKSSSSDSQQSNSKIPSVPYKGNLVCIGVLPGLASYTNTSSDESGDDSTTDSDHQSPPILRDLCGRRIVEQQPDNHTDKKK